MRDKVTKCTRCGAYHDWNPDNCLAVKKVTYHGYIYGEHGVTVQHPGITSVEYVSVEEQQELQRQNINAKPPEEVV